MIKEGIHNQGFLRLWSFRKSKNGFIKLRERVGLILVSNEDIEKEKSLSLSLFREFTLKGERVKRGVEGLE